MKEPAAKKPRTRRKYVPRCTACGANPVYVDCSGTGTAWCALCWVRIVPPNVIESAKGGN